MGGVLHLCKDAIGLFLCPSQLDCGPGDINVRSAPSHCSKEEGCSNPIHLWYLSQGIGLFILCWVRHHPIKPTLYRKVVKYQYYLSFIDNPMHKYIQGRSVCKALRIIFFFDLNSQLAIIIYLMKYINSFSVFYVHIFWITAQNCKSLWWVCGYKKSMHVSTNMNVHLHSIYLCYTKKKYHQQQNRGRILEGLLF